ncbi:MAG: hypothetical protein RIQ88_202 [Actinomycetota bacterium]
MSLAFELIPAVDLIGGSSVRLAQGFEITSSQAETPEELIAGFISDGAHWIHLADIDQALGRGSNIELVTDLISKFPETSFQLSGGIRDQFTFDQAANLSPARINISTSSLANRKWLEDLVAKHKNQVSFALDFNQGQVVARGSKEAHGSLDEVLDFLISIEISTYIVTDNQRDGMLAGPNYDLLSHVIERTEAKVIASGGISSLEEIHSLSTMQGIAGVVLGKALYSGKFTLSDAFGVIKN